MNSINTHPLYDYALELYIREEKTSKEIADLLIAKGVEPREAVQLAFDVEVNVDQFKRSKGQKEVLWGLAMLFGGILTTYFSYSQAVDRGGGLYIIKYGLVLAGIISLVKGIQKLV